MHQLKVQLQSLLWFCMDANWMLLQVPISYCITFNIKLNNGTLILRMTIKGLDQWLLFKVFTWSFLHFQSSFFPFQLCFGYLLRNWKVLCFHFIDDCVYQKFKPTFDMFMFPHFLQRFCYLHVCGYDTFSSTYELWFQVWFLL